MAPQALEKDLDLYYLFPTSLPTHVVGDRTRLQQILWNLLSNAVKFTPAGSVVVAVSGQPLPTSPSERETILLDFEVRDSGIGIPADRLHLLFRPFSQTDSSMARRYGGTGLGLAICRSLCLRMEGDIGLTSREGVGSTFTFQVRLGVDHASREDWLTRGTANASPSGWRTWAWPWLAPVTRADRPERRKAGSPWW
jgi:signal transduction histidine kinase